MRSSAFRSPLCDYFSATFFGMRGTKTEISPGVWRLRVYVGRRANGTPIQVTKTVRAPLPKGAKSRRPGSGKSLADKELASLVNKAGKGQLRQTGSGPTVAQVLADYIELCELRKRSRTTIREYERIADNVLIPELGHIRAQALSAKHLNRLYADLGMRGNKATTVRRVHALISASLKQAKKVGDLERNVALDADLPAVEAAGVGPVLEGTWHAHQLGEVGPVPRVRNMVAVTHRCGVALG